MLLDVKLLSLAVGKISRSVLAYEANLLTMACKPTEINRAARFQKELVYTIMTFQCSTK